MNRGGALVLASWLAMGLAGCGSTGPSGPVGSPQTASAEPTAVESTSSPNASPATTVVPAPTPVVSLGRFPVCPDRSFDSTATLGPEFANEYFLGDESKAIAADFVAQLQGLYAATPDADPCATFTRNGLETALAMDARLRAVADGVQHVDGDLVLRMRSEGEYDLRVRPPAVPLNVIFDLAAGSRVTDLATGAVEVSEAAQRVGLRVDFVFDGHRWHADKVGPITEPSDLSMAAIPTAPPPGPPCTGFRRDPAGTAFDSHAGPALGAVQPRRPWCDDGGRGRLIHVPEQLVFFTAFPCDRGNIAILTIGRSVGAALDPLVRWEYMRDPKGEALAQGWLRGNARWNGHAKLPADARSTGWTNGNIEIWTSASEHDAAIYAKRGDVVERWPRAADFWGVTDCN